MMLKMALAFFVFDKTKFNVFIKFLIFLQVYLSTRRGAWVMNRVGPNGVPLGYNFSLRLAEVGSTAVQKYRVTVTRYF